FEALPVPVRRRSGPQIHHDVEDCSVRASHQLRLAVPATYVQSAHRAAYRARLAVLNEGGRVEVDGAQHLRFEGAAEEAPIIDMRARPKQQSALDARNRNNVHEPSLSAAAPMLARSRPPSCGGQAFTSGTA